MVYEAHSTDYQTPANLRALVQRHFAILKVGPGLTFAMREALWVWMKSSANGWEPTGLRAAGDGSAGHDGCPPILEQILPVRGPPA
jgi:hypothetical protein